MLVRGQRVHIGTGNHRHGRRRPAARAADPLCSQSAEEPSRGSDGGGLAQGVRLATADRGRRRHGDPRRAHPARGGAAARVDDRAGAHRPRPHPGAGAGLPADGQPGERERRVGRGAARARARRPAGRRFRPRR